MLVFISLTVISSVMYYTIAAFISFSPINSLVGTAFEMLLVFSILLESEAQSSSKVESSTKEQTRLLKKSDCHILEYSFQINNLHIGTKNS